jgi:hypothetical protein
MERSGECENSRPARSATEAPSEFDEALIGFSATVTKEDLPLAGDFDETAGEIRLGTCAVEIGGMNELACLPADRSGDLRVRVPERAHGNAGTEV